jgi:hypothetical protein
VSNIMFYTEFYLLHTVCIVRAHFVALLYHLFKCLSSGLRCIKLTCMVYGFNFWVYGLIYMDFLGIFFSNCTQN